MLRLQRFSGRHGAVVAGEPGLIRAFFYWFGERLAVEQAGQAGEDARGWLVVYLLQFSPQLVPGGGEGPGVFLVTTEKIIDQPERVIHRRYGRLVGRQRVRQRGRFYSEQVGEDPRFLVVPRDRGRERACLEEQPFRIQALRRQADEARVRLLQLVSDGG